VSGIAFMSGIAATKGVRMLVTSLLVKGSVAAAVAATAGAVGFANVNAPASPAPGASSVEAAATGDAVTANLRTVLRRFEHGELTAARKSGSITYDVQRGRVTSISATSLVVTSADGFEGDFAITSQTKARVDQRPSNTASVHLGDRVAVLGTDGRALVIVDRTVDRQAPAGGGATPDSPSA
jgi:hypothetical protein